MLTILLFLFLTSSTTDPGQVDETCAFLPAGTPCDSPPPTCPAAGPTLCQPIGGDGNP